jgi:oligopeptide/dipeptide ABC transporter ATP-binding protein
VTQSGSRVGGAAEPVPGEPALLTVRDLKVHFGDGPGAVRAVDGVDFSLRAGETLALVGESGCGKSTLALATVGLASRGSIRGSIRLKGRELVGLSRRALRPYRGRLQMVFQDPEASLDPRMTVSSLIGEALFLHSRGRQARSGLDSGVARLMEEVGLDPGLRNRYPHEFSGGQQQRVAIARALAVAPDVLLCDEVTSALDVSVQAQILNLLRDLQRDLGLAMLFITHDLGVVRHMADRVAVMYVGQIVEEREVQALFETPAHPYTQALLAAVPRIGSVPGTRLRLPGDVASASAPPAGCRFHPRCARVQDRCRVGSAPPAFEVEGGRSHCYESE